MDKQRLINDVRAAVEEIAAQCKEVIQMVMASDRGYNDKAVKNTLIDSNLYNEIQTRVGQNIDMIEMLVNPYIKYVEKGRKPNEPFPWKIAVNVLAEWCARKLGDSSNRTVYFVWKSIVEKGITARPIFDEDDGGVWYVISDKYWDDWAEDIINAMLIQINEFFND